jgi:uncharacterized membrane protein
MCEWVPNGTPAPDIDSTSYLGAWVDTMIEGRLPFSSEITRKSVDGMAHAGRDATNGVTASVHHWRLRWPGLIALIVAAGIYLILPDSLVVGPVWALPAALALLVVWHEIARRGGRHELSRRIVLGITALLTTGVIASVILLVARLPGKGTAPSSLLRDAGVIWSINVLAFAMWYWEIDGGGPVCRARSGYRSTDFVFPQMSDGPAASPGWSPTYLDYLFLAFNTSTAFSPTDTLALSHRVKVLMMAQSLISVVIVGALIARAINTL